MNKRIRELAEQAFFDEATSQPSNKMYTFSDHKMQKFAELIVRECAGIASEYDAPKMSGPGMIIANRIESHFGVEE